VQGHFARQDAYFAPAAVEAFESKLAAGKVPHEFHWYDADHAFGNETGDHHDPAAAKLAWERTLAFLKKQFAG